MTQDESLAPMSDEERIDIITDIARHCATLKKAGIGWRSILREAIFFVWEVKDGKKYYERRPHTKAARSAKKTDLRSEHALPLRFRPRRNR